MKQFKVFSKDDCTLCTQTKTKMQLKGVNYVEIKKPMDYIQSVVKPLIPVSHRKFPIVFVGDVDDDDINNFEYVANWETFTL